MLPGSICFVDIETTGTSAAYNRIIEIGIVKILDGKRVYQYKQLINPEAHIDPFIEKLTGITTTELENAPIFPQVADEIYEILKDSVFVAHNVRFDYGFLKNEYRRMNKTFKLKHFCTVKLARLLYPNLGRFNLDRIIENFNIKIKNRHRAFDDALVLYNFYKIAQNEIEKTTFENAVNIALKRPTVPLNLNQSELDNLPESPGVYKFYGKDNLVLYIGKSINIHDRVLSHFSNDYISSTDMKIAREITRIETIQTKSELEALLLESTLIKKDQPIFNKRLRYARKMTILIKEIDNNGYNRIAIADIEQISIEQIENIMGVFKSVKEAKNFLYEASSMYALCPLLLNLEKSVSTCFSFQLDKCLGACVKKELNIKYNLRFDEAFYSKKIRKWKFDGPIILREKRNSKEGFVIDKWCLLGKINSDLEDTELIKEYRFDLDTYKILTRYLHNKDKTVIIDSYKSAFAG